MSAQISIIRGDITTLEVDAIVNFAAESHVDRSILEPTAFLHTGVMGVYALLHFRAGRDSEEEAS